MQSTYSWMGSRLHLVLEDKIAEGYNKVTDAFLKAQIEIKETTGSQWKADQPLFINVTEEEMNDYNAVGSVINLLIEINGGSLDIKEEDCTTDQLVKL